MAGTEVIFKLISEASAKNAAANPDGGGNAGSDKKKGEGLIKGGLKKAGISFSLASILKQSQLFTGFLGSLFQILGGMVDLMLVPLIPPMMAFLTWLAKQMPLISKIGQFFVGSFVDYITGIFGTFKKAWDLFKEAYQLFKDGEYIAAIKKAFQGIGYLLWGVVKVYFAGIFLSWGKIFFLLPGIWNGIKDAFKWLKSVLTIDFYMSIVLKGLKLLTDIATGLISIFSTPLRTLLNMLRDLKLPKMLGGGKPFGAMPEIPQGMLDNPLAGKIEIMIAGLTPQQTVEVEQAEEKVRVTNMDQQILSAGYGF